MTSIYVGDRDIDYPSLQEELAGVAPQGIQIRDGYLFTQDEPPAELPPEAVPIVDAHDASLPKRTAAFETQEDAERLRLVAERAATDPAFAALADLALGRGIP